MLNRWISPAEQLGPLAIRMAVGLVFIVHGGQKLFGWLGGGGLAETAQFLEPMGFTVAPMAWAILLAVTEFLGGIALVLGFLTRYAAFALAVSMAVAVGLVHLQNGFLLPDGTEFAFVLLAANLTLLVGGAGQASVDWWVRRRYPRAAPAREERRVA